MKKIVLILLFLFSINSIKAQFAKNHSLYATTELNYGNYRTGVDLNLNYIHKNTYSFKIGYSGHLRQAESTPDDYSVGLANILFRGFGLLDYPYDQLQTYQFTAGIIFNLNKSRTLRLNFSGGVGYTLLSRPENWERQGGLLESNYSWNYQNRNTASLIFNPKLEFISSSWYGLTVSPLFILNSQSSYYGIGLGQMIGVLRERTKK